MTATRRVRGAAPGRPSTEQSPSGLERTLQAIGLVAAPLTLVTALLFWVAWLRTSSVFGHFGVDPALVGLSQQDYLIRSVDVIWAPVGVLLCLGLLGAWIHGLARRYVVESRRRRAAAGVAAVLLVLGVPTFLLAVAVTAHLAPLAMNDLTVAVLLGGGIIATGYGRWLLRCLPVMRTRRVVLPPRNLAELTLIALILVLSMFWAVSAYSTAVGRELGDQFATNLARRPGVVVYSAQRLFLLAPGVTEELLPDKPPAAYHYRYTGLRLLAESPTRLFLVPPVWGPNASTLVVDYGPGIRIDLTSGSGQ